MARLSQSNLEMLHIRTKSMPIEASNSMSFVEAYHVPVRHEYKIIINKSLDTSDEEVLQIAIKSLNNSVSFDGLLPTLLCCCTLSRVGLLPEPPFPGTFKRAVAFWRLLKRVLNILLDVKSMPPYVHGTGSIFLVYTMNIVAHMC